MIDKSEIYGIIIRIKIQKARGWESRWVQIITE